MPAAAINTYVVLRMVRCMGSPSLSHVDASAFLPSLSRGLPPGTPVRLPRRCMRLQEPRASSASSHTKGARNSGCCHHAGLRAPSRSHSEWFPLDRHTIIRVSMSVHLVEEGLAMIAGSSYIAGPSVYVTSGPASHPSRLHLLRVDRGNKKDAN